MDAEQLTAKISDIFLNWQVLLISFATFALLGVIKSIGTTKDKDGNIMGGVAQHKWFQTFLPAFPYVMALILCFLPGVPLPEIVTKTIAVKVLYSVYAGWLSDKSYQLITNVIDKMIKKVAT